jgi:RhoGAP domain
MTVGFYERFLSAESIPEKSTCCTAGLRVSVSVGTYVANAGHTGTHVLILWLPFLCRIDLRLAYYRSLVASLPEHNCNLLRYTVEFLRDVSKHSDENKMTAINLATVVGPNILVSKEDVKIDVGVRALAEAVTCCGSSTFAERWLCFSRSLTFEPPTFVGCRTTWTMSRPWPA